jgi:hypothetical protein
MTAENLEKIKKVKAFQILPTLQSKDVEWINWIKALDKDFDRDTAVSLFLKLWSKRGTNDANTIMLRKEIKSRYNIDLTEGTIDKIADLGGGFVDTIGGVFKVGKVVWLATIGIGFVAIGAIIYAVVKNPSNVLYATPQGRALKMIGGK